MHSVIVKKIVASGVIFIYLQYIYCGVFLHCILLTARM